MIAGVPTNAGRLEFQQGSGVIGCFALPFVLVGFLIWYLASIHPPHPGEPFFMRVVFPFLAGSVFVIGPLWIALNREWVSVDSLGVEYGSGLFRPSEMRRTQISELSRIIVVDDVKAPRRQRYAVVTEGSGSPITLTRVEDADEATRLARRVGELTGLPVEQLQ